MFGRICAISCITLLAPGGVARAQDLALASPVVPYSGNPPTAAGAAFTVRVTIVNNSGFVAQPLVLDYHYCPSVSPTGCVLLGSSSVSYFFGPASTTTVVSPTLVLPTAARCGPGFLRFVVDATNVVVENNESNNELYTSITLSTLPNLSFLDATVPYSGSVSASGSTFTGRYSIANAPSTCAVDADFGLAYYLCPGMTSTGCVLLGQDLATQSFSSGDSRAMTSSPLTMPSVTPGTMYIRARIDPGDVIAESNESDNERYDAITIAGGDRGVDGTGHDGLAVDRGPTDRGPAGDRSAVDAPGWSWPDGPRAGDAFMPGDARQPSPGGCGCGVHGVPARPSLALLLLLLGCRRWLARR
jgi:hypothetical protein